MHRSREQGDLACVETRFLAAARQPAFSLDKTPSVMSTETARERFEANRLTIS
jgi:hypothetical protein